MNNMAQAVELMDKLTAAPPQPQLADAGRHRGLKPPVPLRR